MRFISPKTPSISVIMPAYNTSPHLAEAIQSILAQSFTDFELLVINDGSTDGSADIVRSYRDARVALIENPVNKGLAYSLNRAIGLAHGKYIARMDADDIAHVDRLKKQYEFMEDNTAIDVCGTWAETIDARPKIMRYPSCDEEIKSTLFFKTAFAHPTVMFRASSLKDGGWQYADVVAEDYDLWCRMAWRFRMANLPEVLLHYRIHPQQITAAKDGVIADGTARIRGSHIESLLCRALSHSEKKLVNLFYGKAGYAVDFCDVAALFITISNKNRERGIAGDTVFSRVAFEAMKNLIRKSCNETSIMSSRFVGAFMGVLTVFGAVNAFRFLVFSVSSRNRAQ